MTYTYRVCPQLSEVPPGAQLAIDGQYQDIRVERGRVYTTKDFNNGLGYNRVTIKGLTRVGPGRYVGEGESFNALKKLSAFGPVTIDIVEPYRIRLTYGMNNTTGLKEGHTDFWTATQLDDEQAFLRELDQKPDTTLSSHIHHPRRLTDRTALDTSTLTDADPAVPSGEKSSKSQDAGEHKTPLKNKIWMVGDMWGVMAEVEKEDQSIFANADLSRGLESGMLPGDQTTINVVRRVNADTIEIGVGSKVQFVIVQTPQGNESRPLYGHPGSTVVLQPGWP